MYCEVFAQYIFSCISHRALDAQRYDVSENVNHYGLNEINYKMRENNYV